MKLRVRVQNLVIVCGLEAFVPPCLADTVFDLPEDPVPADHGFEGKQLVTGSPFEIEVKWGIKGVVGHLQKRLNDDSALNCASIWFAFDSAKSPHYSFFKAFLKGRELPISGIAGMTVER